MKITFFGNNLKSSRVFSKLNCTKICNQKIAYVLCFLVFIKHNYIKQSLFHKVLSATVALRIYNTTFLIQSVHCSNRKHDHVSFLSSKQKSVLNQTLYFFMMEILISNNWCNNKC